MVERSRSSRIQMVTSDEMPQAPVEEAGISLDELGTAYEQAILTAIQKTGATTTENDSASEQSGNGIVDADEKPLAAPIVKETDGVPVTPESILEAMLFVGAANNASLERSKVVEIFRGVSVEEIDAMVVQLNQLYERTGRAMEIHSDGTGFRMQLRPAMHYVRDRFYGKVRETTLSQSAIDCLALVAYQPGITKEELEKQWNQPAGTMLSSLIRKGLLRVDIVRADGSVSSSKGTHHYYTTDKFLDVIGLESLNDLPQTEEM